MLLRYGVIAMTFSVMLALVVIAIVTIRDKPEEVAAEGVAAANSESKTEQAYQDPRDKMLDLPTPKSEPQPEQPKQASEPEQVPEDKGASRKKATPSSAPSSDAAPEPAPRAQPEVAQQQSSLPLASIDWPDPAQKEVKAASKPRRYNWTPGAIMSLTVDALGIYNAPVMRSDTQAALRKGVGHVPETSLPWDRSPQTNVYLAAHRYGWPNTKSRLLFFNLNKLGRGDKVVLKDRRGRTYRYRVSETLVVDPNDRWVMGQVVGKHMLTLQTCTPIPTFEKRLIVRANRV